LHYTNLKFTRTPAILQGFALRMGFPFIWLAIWVFVLMTVRSGAPDWITGRMWIFIAIKIWMIYDPNFPSLDSFISARGRIGFIPTLNIA
jgi:hypothetical protein